MASAFVSGLGVRFPVLFGSVKFVHGCRRRDLSGTETRCHIGIINSIWHGSKDARKKVQHGMDVSSGAGSCQRLKVLCEPFLLPENGVQLRNMPQFRPVNINSELRVG